MDGLQHEFWIKKIGLWRQL